MDEQQQFWLLCALLREQVYRVWDLAVLNARNPTALQRFEAMQDVVPGKIVCETSLRVGDPRNSHRTLVGSWSAAAARLGRGRRWPQSWGTILAHSDIGWAGLSLDQCDVCRGARTGGASSLRSPVDL